MSVRADLGAMLMIVGRALSAIAAGRASYRGMRCLLPLWRVAPARCFWFGRTLSAIAAGRASGEWGVCCSCGRADPARCFWFGRTLSAIAAGRASYRGMGCLLLLWEGRPGAMLLIFWVVCEFDRLLIVVAQLCNQHTSI